MVEIEKKYLQRLVLTILGWSFIVLGVLGLFLPILQGVLFLFIGLYILSHTSTWAQRLLSKIKQRYPHQSHQLEEARKNAGTYLQKLFGKTAKDQKKGRS